MATPRDAPVGDVSLHDAERLRFFTDAVVAIAMTLLILPLIESVSEAAAEHLSTAEFLADHRDQLVSFLISFFIIAAFWRGHERLFSYVGVWNSRLVTLNVLWMLTIVFLPVATAMTGSLETDDLQIVVYVGTMWLSSLLMLALNLVVRRDPSLWAEGRVPGTRGVAASIALLVLFAVALVVALLLPADTHYLAMFLLLLSGALQSRIDRRLRAGAR